MTEPNPALTEASSTDLEAPSQQPKKTTARQAQPAAATELVEMATELYQFGRDTTGEVFGVPLTGPRITFMLRGGGRSLRNELAKKYFTEHGKAASSQALADAMITLEGIGEEWETELHTRIASDGLDRSVWVDLGDLDGRAIHITEHHWNLHDRAPVLFRRSALTSPLPTPVRHPDGLDLLWGLLNVTPEDRPLVAAWLVAALVPGIAHPILALFGEQGTGKSTATKLVVSIVDPSPAPTRTPPKDQERWITAAAASWVVGIDNLSGVSEWFSDALCRAVTGTADVRRRLYSDKDLEVFSFRRAIALNGIDIGDLRGDLAERLLPINLDRIPDHQRLEETELDTTWASHHPHVLAAVLDLTTAVFAHLPHIELASKPRMADFARITAAVDHVLGTTGLDRYTAKQGSMATDAIDTDPFIAAVTQAIRWDWEGTSADLLAVVDPAPEPLPKGWPTSSRAVTGRLKRWAPVLRKVGWTVDNDAGTNRYGTTRWTITAPNPPPPDQR
ncbi:MAG: ATP-binding protein [Actinomycetota bacterium]